MLECCNFVIHTYNPNITMKTKITILALFFACIGFSSCREPLGKQNLSAIAVDPSEITLNVGEKKALVVNFTPANAEVKVSFSSDNEKVAIVSEKGEITAISEGKTTIKATAGEKVATCVVTVVNSSKTPPVMVKNELPLIRFVLMDGATRRVKDPAILEYEKSMGRVLTPINYGSNVFNGFANKELPTIPVVIYGLKDSGTPTIVAFSKERVEACDNTLAMLKQNGFSNVKAISEGGERVLVATKDDQDGIKLRATSTTNCEEYGAQMEIWIKNEKEKIIEKKHDLIATAKDFPSWEALTSGKVEQIKSFEEKVGFRFFNGNFSKDNNLFFETKKEKVRESNFEIALYVTNPGEGEKPWINSGLVCIESYDDLHSEEFKSWLALNGYDKNFKWDNSKKTTYVESSDGRVGVMIFIKLSEKTAFMQFADVNDWKSAKFRKQVARQTEAILPLYHK